MLPRNIVEAIRNMKRRFRSSNSIPSPTARFVIALTPELRAAVAGKRLNDAANERQYSPKMRRTFAAMKRKMAKFVRMEQNQASFVSPTMGGIDADARSLQSDQNSARRRLFSPRSTGNSALLSPDARSFVPVASPSGSWSNASSVLPSTSGSVQCNSEFPSLIVQGGEQEPTRMPRNHDGAGSHHSPYPFA